MNGKQKKYLRGLAHEMKPLVQIGQRGLTDAVFSQVDAALSDHELIKVRISAECPDDRKRAAEKLAATTGCDVAGSIGRVLVLYRQNPEAPRIHLPATTAAAATTPEGE